MWRDPSVLSAHIRFPEGKKKDWATNHVLYVFFFSLAFLSEFLCLIYLFCLFTLVYASRFSFIYFFTLFYRNSSFDKFRPLRGAAPYSMTLALMDVLGRRGNIDECLVCALAAAGSRSLITG